MAVDQQTVEIDIDDIQAGVLSNIRTHFDDDKIKELAEGILTDGLINPLLVMETEDENGEEIIALVAGERRLRAIRHIRENLDDEFMDDGVPCATYIGTVEDAQFANANENIEREEVDDVDTSSWIHTRVEEGTSQTDLAKRLHKPLQWVNFRNTFHVRACDELKDLLRKGLISFTAAYELSKNVDEDEQRKRVKKAQRFNEKISLEEAQNAGNPNKTVRPSKKSRATMLSRLEHSADASGEKLHRGAATSLRWVEGLITDEEMEEFIDMKDD